MLRIQQHFQRSVWLNPDPKHAWDGSRTCQVIQQLFPMFHLSVDGIEQAVASLVGAQAAGRHSTAWEAPAADGAAGVRPCAAWYPGSMPAIASLEDAQLVLGEVFGYAEFRAGQGEAVEAAVAGEDALVLLPTGSGKSLCYQVPAISAFGAGHGTTLVISPLIALMQDQVEALRGPRCAGGRPAQPPGRRGAAGRR